MERGRWRHCCCRRCPAGQPRGGAPFRGCSAQHGSPPQCRAAQRRAAQHAAAPGSRRGRWRRMCKMRRRRRRRRGRQQAPPISMPTFSCQPTSQQLGSSAWLGRQRTGTRWRQATARARPSATSWGRRALHCASMRRSKRTAHRLQEHHVPSGGHAPSSMALAATTSCAATLASLRATSK